MSITNLPNGLSTDDQSQLMGFFGLPNPTDFHTYFNDFNTYAAADWTITLVGGGSAALDISAVGGALEIDTGANLNDSTVLQKVGRSFQFQSGKRSFFRTRFNISQTVTTAPPNLAQAMIGLVDADTTPYDAADGVFFKKDSGDNTLQFETRKASTGTVKDVFEFVNSSDFIDVGFYYDGDSRVEIYKDAEFVSFVDVTNLPTTPILTPTFLIQAGEAESKQLFVDYIFSSQER